MKPITRHEIVVMLCCNEPDSGMFSGRLTAVSFGNELALHLSCRFDDWAPKIAFIEDKKSISISGRCFRVTGHRCWVGNWCWDAVWMRPETTMKFLNYLKGKKWFHVDMGTTKLFDIWQDGKAQFKIEDAISLCYQK